MSLESTNLSTTDPSKLSVALQSPHKNVCFKAFIITTLVLSLIAIVTSFLAILGFNGMISGVNSISQLLKIGQVNSYLILTAGTAMFGVGLASWFCQLKKERSLSDGYGSS